MKSKINWDKIGVTTSLLCAVHCLILPLLLTSLPVLGIDMTDNAGVEAAMIVLAFVVGFIALAKGRKEYRSYLPITFFIIGISCLILKEVFHEWHHLILIPAVVFILLAHYTNYKMTKAAHKYTL